ncbi:ATP-binding protein [Noviherbaspirillum massiliense]|nr:ATP-binding protein [Noviherbaspirillum massiliense]
MAILVACVFWLTAVLALSIALMRERSQSLQQAQDETSTMATVLEENMARTFGSVDIALLGISSYFASRSLSRHDPQARKLMLKYLQYLPAVRALFVIGPNGFIQHDTDYPTTPDVSLMDRDYFRQYIENENLKQGLSSAMLSRSGTGWFVASTRRIVSPSGEFKGVVVAAVQLDSLSRLYHKLHLRPGQVMSLYHADGRLIARHPDDDASIGRTYGHLPLFALYLPRERAASYTTAGPPFNYQRIASYRGLEHQPLVVVLSTRESVALEAWRRTATGAIGAAVVLSLLMFSGVFFYIQRQQQVQRAIALQAAQAEATALAEANAKFRTFFEQGRYFACVLSRDGTILEANDASLIHSGYTREQVIGQKYWSGSWWSNMPDHAENVEKGFEQVLNGRAFTCEAIYSRADGTRRMVELVLSPILDANEALLAVAAVGIDITDRKLKEEKLRDLADELTNADRLKGEFLATLSHELRNLLAPLQSGLDILERLPPDSPATSRARRILQNQTDQMGRMIEDLLDVARINSGKVRLECERVDLRDVLVNVAESAQTFMEPAGHEFKVSLPDAPLHMDVDAGRMHQVFINLLSNAAKYTPPGGQIELSAFRKDHEAVVQISDNGIGIPVEAQAKIFQMFEQIGEHGSKAQGGLGIGLALVQRLVALHGGRVEAFSEGANLGSTFTVHLPLTGHRVAPS